MRVGTTIATSNMTLTSPTRSILFHLLCILYSMIEVSVAKTPIYFDAFATATSTATIATTTNTNCTNSQTFTFGSYTYKNQIVQRTCAWIVENPNPNIIDARREKWCDTTIVVTTSDANNGTASAPISDSNSVKVKEECPVSCDVCEVDNGHNSGGDGSSGGNEGVAFDLNDCSTYESLWQAEINESCGLSITSDTCKCADADSKIVSGEIQCPTQCPLGCNACELCLGWITDCLYAPTPQPTLTVQPTVSPSSQPTVSDAPSSSPSISCTGRVVTAPTDGGGDATTKLIAYGLTGMDVGSRDVVKIDYQYDLAISDAYPMIITDEGEQDSTTSPAIVKLRTTASPSMELNVTTFSMVLEEIAQTISSIVAGNVFSECMWIRRRLVVNSTNADIDVVGMTSTVGEVIPTVSCIEDESQPGSTCVVVGFTTSLYYLNDNKTSESDLDDLKQRVKILTMSELSNLDGDLYAVKSVKAVERSDNNEQLVVDPPTLTPTPAIVDDPLSGVAIGMIAMGSGIGLLLFGFIFYRRRRSQHDDEEEDLKNQFMIDDIHDGSFPVKDGSVDGANSKLGAQSVDIDYSFNDKKGKDKMGYKIASTDEEAMIEDDTDGKSPSTPPVAEELESNDKKLFSMDGFKNRLSVARSMFTNGSGVESDTSTISSKEARNHNLNNEAQYFSSDSFKHRMNITRNTIDSPARSARTRNPIIDSPARSAHSRITNPVSEITSDNSLIGSITSKDRIRSARTLILGIADPAVENDKPIENEVEKESPGTQSSEETNGSESDSENYNTEKIKNSEGNDETSKLPSIEQIDLTPKKSNHNCEKEEEEENDEIPVS